MLNSTDRTPTTQTSKPGQVIPWHTFSDILKRLHQEGIYIHSHQLAEFFIWHGLPVDLRYVPDHLKQRAKLINTHYRGDMAQLDRVEKLPELFPFE